MTTCLPFRKYHGIGNDFLLFDGLNQPLPLTQLVDPQMVSRICDRHTGVGGDGILLLLQPQSNQAHARMRILNADGSEAEMCGNGIRCAAKALRDHLPQFARMDRISFETGAGVLHCDLSLGSDGLVRSVKVDMGQPILDRAALPMVGEGSFIESPLRVNEAELRATAVSMGNPHLVTFVEDKRNLQNMAQHLGPLVERHTLFPKRTNAEFARLRPDGIELWVWERGCGITLACGTGACATAVAAVVTKRHPASRPLPVHLPGGTLTIQVAEDLSRVWMEGPAVEVFQGELTL